MRYHPDRIRQLLADQAASGQSVLTFCAERDLVVATFYNWRRKYAAPVADSSAGFCKLVPRPQTTAKKLRLPSGIELELTGMTTAELTELILAIDGRYA